MAISDRIKKMVDEAPVQRQAVPVNFGPLRVTPVVKTFHGKGNKPDVVTLEDFAKKHGSTVDEVVLGDNDAFNLRFDINVKDLNDSLQFDDWTREVPVVASNKSNKDKNKWILTDWEEIVLPSLEAIFGKDWYNTLIGTSRKPAQEVYVAAEQVDSLRPVAAGAKNYGVPKFIARYKNRDECVRARDLRYPPREAAGTEVDEEETVDGSFPDEVVEQVAALYGANRSNDEKTLKMLAKRPFGDYEPEALLAAAKASLNEESED